MGYKGTSFFSPAMYRDLVQPFHRRAVDWAHEHGIYAQLHSCGNIMGLLPDVLDTGIDALNPLEVKAGMDALAIKAQYGDRVVLRGGINAVKWPDADAIVAEIAEKVPVLKQGGGFIFSSDHSIPNNVSLENMRRIVAEVKRVGTY
jgi:uroporphyrinogen decarboxylase